MLPWLGTQDVASAALAGDAGRSGSCSVPGKALADDYRRHLDRVAGQRWPDCSLRPQSGRLRSAPLQAQGSPASRAPSLPQVLSGGSHQVGAGPRRPLYRSVPFWDVVALRSYAPFILLLAGGEQPCTRARTSNGRCGRETGEGEEFSRRWRALRRRYLSR